MNKVPERIMIASHPARDDDGQLAKHIASYLRENGVQVEIKDSVYDAAIVEGIKKSQVDLLIAIGGDGTMLRAGHICAPFQVPILGINAGSFGFLMEVEADEWREKLDILLCGDYRLEDRMMLEAVHFRGEKVLGRFDVLNEVVVCRGRMVRPIRLHAYVDGYLLSSYVADGLIAATPTGSTAYALAAGGPVMPPEMRNILIMPIAPHLSMDRAIILPLGSCVSFVVSTDHEAVMSIDGKSPVDLDDRDRINVSVQDYAAKFIRFQDPGYFHRNLNKYMEQNPSKGK
ncbi:MAG: NAD(+)/NADH kinase [Anaerolineaceae bacterium]|nr:NAD(+)/NADH kinase [Anaerolineaceae bacterium]